MLEFLFQSIRRLAMKPQGNRRMTRFLQPRHPKLKATSEQRGIVEGIHVIFWDKRICLNQKRVPHFIHWSLKREPIQKGTWLGFPIPFLRDPGIKRSFRLWMKPEEFLCIASCESMRKQHRAGHGYYMVLLNKGPRPSGIFPLRVLLNRRSNDGFWGPEQSKPV